MKDTTKQRLRLADRALRPSAAARREQARVQAEGNALLAQLRDDLAQTRSSLDAVHQRLDNLEQVVVEVARSAGVIDERNANYDRWTELIIKEALAQGGVGIDVGAHSGLILRSIIDASPDARHVAFEPIPALAAGLRRDFPGVEVHEIALAEAEGEVEFHHVTSNPSYSGIRRRRYDAPEEVEVIKVRTAPLDDIVGPDVAVRFLKIDVEGAELGVLAGAGRILSEHHPVTVFEFGIGASDVYGTTPADIHGLFASHGMVVGLLDAYLQERRPLSAEELDEQYTTAENFYFVAWAPEPATAQ